MLESWAQFQGCSKENYQDGEEGEQDREVMKKACLSVFILEMGRFTRNHSHPLQVSVDPY
jgi:hypothetical protein